MKTVRASPLISTHNKTIKEATGVDFIIVIMGEKSVCMMENLLQSIANSMPKAEPSASPAITLKQLKITDL